MSLTSEFLDLEHSCTFQKRSKVNSQLVCLFAPSLDFPNIGKPTNWFIAQVADSFSCVMLYSMRGASQHALSI